MEAFQKSLIRFLYVALVVVAVAAIWRGVCPCPKASSGAAAGYGYGPAARGVTATGTCVVRTKPELAEVTLGVSQSADTARAAKEYVKSVSRKIAEALKQGGVNEKDIQTQDFRLQMVWKSESGWQAKSWKANETLRVRIRQIDKAADLIDGAVKMGATKVGELSYTVDDVNTIRAKGRTKAAAVARKKAQELASLLGGKVGKLTACTEHYPGSYNYDGYSSGIYRAQANVEMDGQEADLGGAEELTLQPGQMVTRVVVTATYELE
jgi:uncharacterized protein YggE